MSTSPYNQLLGIFYHLRMQIAFLGVTLQDLRWVMVDCIIFIECLQCDGSRLPAYPWHGILE